MAEEKTLAYLHWESLVQSNDFYQADKFYEKMKDTQQLNVEICFVMGLWYRQMQQYGKAADAFVQGLLLKPDSSDLYYELANTMREMGAKKARNGIISIAWRFVPIILMRYIVWDRCWPVWNGLQRLPIVFARHYSWQIVCRR